MRYPVTRLMFAACAAGLAMVAASCQNAAPNASTAGSAAAPEAPATTATSAPPTAAPAPPAATPPAPAAASPQHWIMPKLVGSNLQQAQDAIQALTGNELFFTSSHDATGKHRNQVIDSNWKVCSQNIPAGSQITADSKIDFGAVKLAESCP